MTAVQVPDPWYRLPHPPVYPPLAAGIYWRATCQCHLNQVVGLNHFADRKRGTR